MARPTTVKMLSPLIALMLSIGSPGCSFFVEPNQTLFVTTSEKNAEILINGNPAGKGEVTQKVPKNQNVVVTARKDGYDTAIRHINKKMSVVGIVDILGGFVWLVPFFGLLAPGAWQLEQNSIKIQMEKS